MSNFVQEATKKEYYNNIFENNIFENLRKEYGANLSNDVHELVVVATLNLIEHYKDKQIIKLDDNEKMICDIYPKISAFLN